MTMSKIFKTTFCIFVMVALYGMVRTSAVQAWNDSGNCVQWTTGFFAAEDTETDEVEVMEADILPAGVAENDKPDATSEEVGSPTPGVAEVEAEAKEGA